MGAADQSMPTWIENLTEAGAKRELARKIEDYKRMRARAEKAEYALANVRTIYILLERAIYDLPENKIEDEGQR